MAEAAEKTKVTALRKVEAPAPEQAAAPVTTKRPRRWRRWILLAAGPLLVAGGVSYFWLTGGRYVSTDNAYIQADIVNIATDVSGLVTKIEVGDNQLVKKGQVLFELDQTTYRTALESAEANVALVRTQLEALRASYAQSAANIAKAESDVTFYEREFQRQTDLANRRVNAEMQLDAARHNLETARGQLAALQQEQAGIAAQLGGDPQAPIEEHPRYKAAVAARDRAQTDLEHTVVRASINGRTARVPSLQPGEFLQAGQAAFAIVATDDLWIEANPKETDLTFVQPGQPVAISVDTYPGQEWQGAVASLSPASQAQFSLLPAQNASGNWVKVVQRIPLRIKVHQDPAAPELRAGMSAEIEVDTGHQRHLRDLVSWL